MPKVSVILATWNAVASVSECIESVLSQEGVAIELIVADGGSSDGTVEILRSNSDRLHWWRSAPDRGIYDAWNIAIEHATGDYITFLGSDDRFVDRRSLAGLLGVLGARRPCLVTSRGRIRSVSGHRSSTVGAAWNWKRIGRRMVICHPGLLHHRSLFSRYGLFNSELRIVGDLEFLLRLPRDIETVDVPVVLVDIGPGGISRRKIRLRLREQRQVLARHERFGQAIAWLCWIDRLLRFPIARVLNIPY
jgi:glycosyltransferase involved in cell wall biosynthesis